MPKLKLQYFGHLMGRANSLEKTLMLGKIDGCKFVQTLGDSEGQGSLVCCSPWGCKEVDTTERLNNHHKTDGLDTVVPVSHS